MSSYKPKLISLNGSNKISDRDRETTGHSLRLLIQGRLKCVNKVHSTRLAASAPSDERHNCAAARRSHCPLRHPKKPSQARYFIFAPSTSPASYWYIVFSEWVNIQPKHEWGKTHEDVSSLDTVEMALSAHPLRAQRASVEPAMLCRLYSYMREETAETTLLFAVFHQTDSYSEDCRY